MFVFLKFAGEFNINLSENWLFTSSFRSVEFLSKESNSVESILMFFELHNKELVGFTSGNVKLDEGFVDVFKSSGDPFKMSMRISDFSFDSFSFSGGFFSDISVHDSDLGKFGNKFITINLLLGPSGIMFSLFIIDGSFKLFKKILTGINGVRSGGVSKHHVIDLKAPTGTPIILPFRGTVQRVNWIRRVNGNCVEVKYSDGNLRRFLHLHDVSKDLRPG